MDASSRIDLFRFHAQGRSVAYTNHTRPGDGTAAVSLSVVWPCADVSRVGQ